MEVIKFEDFINFDKRIGKMIISGLEGFGKTLLLTAIAMGKMVNGWKDCCKSYEKTTEYNRLGYNFSKKYQHCCFANYPIQCLGTVVPSRKVYVVDPFRLGYFREDYKTDFYPPYSLFCITEGKNYFDSYMFDKFHPTFLAYLKTMRHFNLDMVIDSQYFGDICTTFRKICNRFILLTDIVEEIKDIDGQVCGHRLFVTEWKNNRDVELYERTTKKQNCKEYELILDFSVYGNYDTEYCKYLHLKGRQNQDYHIEEFPEIKTVDDIEHCNFIEFNPPDGFFKSNTSKKNSDKSDKQQYGDLEENMYF